MLRKRTHERRRNSAPGVEVGEVGVGISEVGVGISDDVAGVIE